MALNPVFNSLVDMNLSSTITAFMAWTALPFAGIGGAMLGETALAFGAVPAGEFSAGFASGFPAGSQFLPFAARALPGTAAQWGGRFGYTAGLARLYNRGIGFDRTAIWLRSRFGDGN